jgi:DNA polymerase-3 subunit delta
MPASTPAAVRKQIATLSPDPIYLLQGEDEAEKLTLAVEFAELVEEGLRAFNVERINAGEWTTGDRLADGVGSIVAAARTLPMMAPRRLVLVAQADALLAPKRESESAARAHEELESLLKAPEPLTILVFLAGALDKRSRMFKLLLKYATIVECGAVEDVADAERWVRSRLAAAGMEVEPRAVRLVAERAGTDVRRLRNDVDRLALYALGRPRVTVDDVREVVGGAAALQDDWAITNAIEAGRTDEALRQLGLLLEAGAPPEKILGQLGWLVRSKFPQIAPDQIRPAIEALFRTDLDLKRTAGDARILLERLIVELTAGRRQRPAGSWR